MEYENCLIVMMRGKRSTRKKRKREKAKKQKKKKRKAKKQKKNNKKRNLFRVGFRFEVSPSTLCQAVGYLILQESCMCRDPVEG